MQNNQTIIHIKNMVCPRCVMSVEQILQTMKIPYSEVTLGTAVLNVPKQEINLKLIDEELKKVGFELLEDKNTKISEQIKTLIISYIHHSENENLKIKFSDYLSKKLGKDYSVLAKIFSDIESVTIEKYLILQKIELVKELITYNELNFSEIAFRLNYSSVAHLSKQFKKNTGKTLTQYKDAENKDRNHLTEI